MTKNELPQRLRTPLLWRYWRHAWRARDGVDYNMSIHSFISLALRSNAYIAHSSRVCVYNKINDIAHVFACYTM
jgi:hypothetical protein